MILLTNSQINGDKYVTFRTLWVLSDNDRCACGEAQTMSHIVIICPQAKLDGSCIANIIADEAAVCWLMSYNNNIDKAQLYSVYNGRQTEINSQYFLIVLWPHSEVSIWFMTT